MSREIFSAPALGFSIDRKIDGSLRQHGQYRNQDVRIALPVDQGARCILLLDQDGRLSKAFRNLLCVDRHGCVVWTAELPTSNDVFVEMGLDDAGLHANSWSGYRVLLDPETGKILRQTYVK